MLAFGEVQTGLLQNSTALSRKRTSEVLSLIVGECVRRSERPIAYAVSPDRLDGVDCRLPTGSGSHTRGVGTLASHATIVGGHIAQGSSHARVQRGTASRRQPWSHYLATPGRIETIGKWNERDIGAGLLRTTTDPATLDISAITGRMLDTVQRSPLLDRNPPLRAPRIRFRWVATLGSPAGRAQAAAGGTFTVVSDEVRTMEVSVANDDLAAVVALCEDLALHDWLLTTLSSLLETTLTSARTRAEKIARLRPAVDHLLHLWMPAARVDERLLTVWTALEHRPGFTRQWDASVTRVRDQVRMSTLEKLEATAD